MDTATRWDPTKRKLAVELLNKLRDHFAPDALMHYGQGSGIRASAAAMGALLLLAKGWSGRFGKIAR